MKRNRLLKQPYSVSMQMKNQRKSQKVESVQASRIEKSPPPLLPKIPQDDASKMVEYIENDETPILMGKNSKDPDPLQEEMPEHMNEEKNSCSEEDHSNKQAGSNPVDDGIIEQGAAAEQDVEKQRQKLNIVSAMRPNKKPLPQMAKIPVLLATVIITVDIFNSLDLESPISSVKQLTWSVNSFKGRLLLPKPIVFFTGILTAALDFVTEEETGLLKTTKVNIPWQTTKDIDWLFPPDMPDKYQKTYEFNSFDGGVHWEQFEKYAEAAFFQLKDFRVVSTEQTVPSSKGTQIDIQASASLTIDILQQQYINI